jgi:hypothetical protein
MKSAPLPLSSALPADAPAAAQNDFDRPLHSTSAFGAAMDVWSVATPPRPSWIKQEILEPVLDSVHGLSDMPSLPPNATPSEVNAYAREMQLAAVRSSVVMTEANFLSKTALKSMQDILQQK